MNTHANTVTASSSTALFMGLSIGDEAPAFQLGDRQYATWLKLTNAQRIEANRLMSDENMLASAALKAVKSL